MERLHQPDELIAGRYRIIATLGRGGIGTTYRAEDQQSGQQVALKELSLRQMRDWKLLELFEREGRVLAALNHPAIPKYLDYFQVDTEQDRHFYLIQELATGESLADLVAQGWHADEATIRDLARQVLEILVYLHGLAPPVVHRDIKPQNLIRDGAGRIALVDFGSVQDTCRDNAAGGSTVIGTYGYMAPEQFRGQAVPATDLYGLGGTILYLLTHRSPADLPQRKLRVDFRASVHVSAGFADWLENLLEPALEDRLPSAGRALAALQDPRLATGQLSHERRQPAGSRIALARSPGKLALVIPPAGWRAQNLYVMVFTIFWNVFVMFWTFTAIGVGAPLFFIAFSIPFWFVGLGLLGSALFTVAGRTFLAMDRQEFHLQWRLLGLSYQARGRTADVDRVELTTTYRQNAQPITALALVEGVRTHRFGAAMAQREKEWLVQELAEFLEKPALAPLAPVLDEVKSARPFEL